MLKFLIISPTNLSPIPTTPSIKQEPLENKPSPEPLGSYVKISWSTLYLSDSLKLSRGGGSALPGAAKVDQLIPTWMLGGKNAQ